MNKLLELNKLENKIRDMLCTIQTKDILLCYHSHCETPSISIYPTSAVEGDSETVNKYGVDFFIHKSIDLEIAIELIEQINEVLK